MNSPNNSTLNNISFIANLGMFLFAILLGASVVLLWFGMWSSEAFKFALAIALPIFGLYAGGLMVTLTIFKSSGRLGLVLVGHLSFAILCMMASWYPIVSMLSEGNFLGTIFMLPAWIAIPAILIPGYSPVQRPSRVRWIVGIVATLVTGVLVFVLFPTRLHENLMSRRAESRAQTDQEIQGRKDAVTDLHHIKKATLKTVIGTGGLEVLEIRMEAEGSVERTYPMKISMNVENRDSFYEFSQEVTLKPGMNDYLLASVPLQELRNRFVGQPTSSRDRFYVGIQLDPARSELRQDAYYYWEANGITCLPSSEALRGTVIKINGICTPSKNGVSYSGT